MTGETLAIIPCTNQKAAVAGPAREVWSGAHFQLVLAHAEMFYDKVLVMSYKYGLISPDAEIEPYDINIRFAPAAEKLKWWFLVRSQIHDLVDNDCPKLVGLYTGNQERERVMREFCKAGLRDVFVPWADARAGERMQRVYDGEPPFSLEELEAGKYTLPAGFELPKKRGRPAKVAVAGAVNQDEEIEWED
jgi:hypothetical protein